MKIYPIETGKFKLDGGAMFGVVPKKLWQRTNLADEQNMCSWSMRCMLIEDGDKLILIDTGIGNKQDENFLKHYHLHGDNKLEKSLNYLGFHKDDITDVFLTHLHFDHCGGAIEYNENKTILQPAFKNAIFWSNFDHWEWATNPNKREIASFLKENIIPIKQSGQLKMIDIPSNKFLTNTPLGFDILFVDGHTDKQMIPFISYKEKKIIFAADLLPSIGHIPLPYIMGYDTRPLLTLTEKDKFLKLVADHNDDYFIFFEHDYVNELCTLKHTEKGVKLDQTFKFTDIF